MPGGLDSESDLLAVGVLVVERRCQPNFASLDDASRAVAGPALVLAALFEGSAPKE
jgi:hypothetical protein